MAIPTLIKQMAHKIRTEIKGKDVRESLAKGIEEAGNLADESKYFSEESKKIVEIYKKQFDEAIKDGDQVVEVQTLRVDPLTGEVHNTAADRFESNQRNVTEKMALTSQVLETVRKYPILPIEEGKVVRKDYPYCHVDRYGGDPSGETVSNEAFQIAFDIAEHLGDGNYYSNQITMLPVRASGGIYVLTKTIKVKYDNTRAKQSRPINFIGESMRVYSSQPAKGTVIIPRIPNHTGKDYANAFAINIRYNSDHDEDDVAEFGGGIGAPIMASISFDNVTFFLDNNEMHQYNINAFKMYRTRFKLHNVNFEGMHEGVRQPLADRLGKSNYCDFGVYHDINFHRIKRGGLNLNTADNTSIARINEHDIQPTAEFIIKISRGSGIKIENLHHAMQGRIINPETQEFAPRNDGTGTEGKKAFVQLINVDGVDIDTLYYERQFFDYMFYFENTRNVNVGNYNEKYISNGFARFAGTCSNFEFKNINRSANMLEEYFDFYKMHGAKLSGIKIKNFMVENYFSETMNLSITDWRNSQFTELKRARQIKTNFTIEDIQRGVEGETLEFYIRYDANENTWKVEDEQGKGLIAALGQPQWDVDGLRLNSMNVYPYKLKSITPCYVSANSMPFLPVSRQGVDKIHFYNINTNTRINIPDPHMYFLISINAVVNKNLIA